MTMKILTTEEEKTKILEKSFFKEKLEALAEQFNELSKNIDVGNDSITVSELASCRAIIDIMLQNFVIYY